MNSISSKKRQYFLVLLCCLIYTFAYIGKYSYTANTVAIISHYNLTKAQAGLISTVFFLTYGSSQILFSFICKKISRKIIVFVVLTLSGLINGVLFFDVPYVSMIVLWGLNGMLQSVLWPSMILTLSNNIDENNSGFSASSMSSTASLGPIIAYLLSSLFIKFNYKYIFLTSAVLLITISFVWLISYNKLCGDNNIKEKIQPEKRISNQPKKLGFLLSFEFFLFVFFVIINALMKDGLNIWVPNILKENFGMSDDKSVLFTVIMLVIGLFGSYFAGFLYKKLKDFVLISMGTFITIAILIGLVIYLLSTELWLGLIIVFGIISFFNHILGALITSIAPMTLKDKFNSGFLSGFLNGMSYVGSAISSFGLGAFADNNGWVGIFLLFLGLCVFSVPLCVIYFIALHKSKKE